MTHLRMSVPSSIVAAIALTTAALLGCDSLSHPIPADSTATLDQTSVSPSQATESSCGQPTRARSYVAVCATTTSRQPDTPIRDIPGSIQVITRLVIDDQKTLRVGDALRNVSGVQTR